MSDLHEGLRHGEIFVLAGALGTEPFLLRTVPELFRAEPELFAAPVILQLFQLFQLFRWRKQEPAMMAG